MLYLRMCCRSDGHRPTAMLLLAGLLAVAGCAESDPAEMDRLYCEWVSSTESAEAWILALHAEALPLEAEQHPQKSAHVVPSPPYWGATSDTRLVRLPCVDEGDSPQRIESASESLNELPTRADRAAVESPEPAVADAGADVEPPTGPELEIPMPDPMATASTEPTSRAIEVRHQDDLSEEERQLLDLITRESLAVMTGRPTDAQLDQQCRAKISSAYTLSQRGAAYAAREELIGVLRLIAQAKDTRDGTRSRTESLAAGLRALDEAEDFVPRGSQLEADMNLAVVTAAHRTPLARELNLAESLPSRLLERYQRYGQIKLAVAVAGEPAGSMALYALGKINSQLGATENETHPLATRKAVAFQQAALLAHNENYLAAHELGVLFAETGHFPEAHHLLSQVATQQPNAVVMQNLARVQQALGNHAEAQLCRHEAARLAQLGRAARPNISWVSPQELSQNQMNNFAPHVASRASAPIENPPATVWR